MKNELLYAYIWELVYSEFNGDLPNILENDWNSAAVPRAQAKTLLLLITDEWQFIPLVVIGAYTYRNVRCIESYRSAEIFCSLIVTGYCKWTQIL
jgi:hypothetical protein